jgi:glycosyl hydrolase family 123
VCSVRLTTLLLGTLCLAGAATPARTADLFFDFGTAQSAVWPGATRVTPSSQFSDTATFGWRTTAGLRAYVRAYTNLVENRSRGTEEPPPIWTNPITEDCIVGSTNNAFLINATAGEYEIYVICGTSEPFRNQFFDFTVRVSQAEQRVQMEGGYQFRSLRFKTAVGSEPLAVEFQPRNKWVCNAILAWPVADSARVENEIIVPLEESIHRMPPEQWAKWKAAPEPPTGPMPPLAEADRRRGFVVYSRHYLECIYPHTKPRAEQLNPTLRLFACPGEYEPANFIVLPQRDLTDARVRISDIGPVPASAIEVRKVRYQLARPNYTVQHRYRVVPDILERFTGSDLKSDENARFWLTIHVPANAPAGQYSSRIEFTCASGTASIPIQLRILPIQLHDDPGKIFGIYYRHPYDLVAGTEDDVSREHFRRRAELEHADMVAHGTRNVTLSCSSPPADAEGRFKFNWDLLAAKLDLWRKHDFRGPVVMSFSTEGVYEKHTKQRYGSHLRGVKDPPEAFSTEITAMVRAIEAERKGRGWPEFLYYPVDEPSTDAVAVSFMAKVLKACKAAGVRTYLTADPTHDQFEPLRPYVDVWSTQPFAPDRETVLADSQSRGVEYWCYPNHVNGENDHTPVAGARMTYGFGFWRSGFRTLIPWIYSATIGDPLNYLDGSSQDFFNRHEPDGTPMPVVLWEAYREGYDDYRYVFTLEQLIAEAKASPSAAARDIATAAEKELQSVWTAIRVQPKYKHDNLWSPEEFDVYRWLVARQILSLQEAMATSR